MKYQIDITVSNIKHGEILETRRHYESLDEMRDLDINELVNIAENNEADAGLVGVFDSKQEADERHGDFTGATDGDR